MANRINQIRKRLERWEDELPKLIQPEREHVANISDVKLLLEIIKIQAIAIDSGAKAERDAYDWGTDSSGNDHPTTCEKAKLVIANLIGEDADTHEQR